MKMKILLSLAMTLFLISGIAHAEKMTSKSFELRYVTGNAAANGETDFKGETSIFSTDDRINFLRNYVDYASDYFGDPALDTDIAPDDEVASALKAIKVQPQPSVRRRMALDTWKWAAVRDGQREESQDAVKAWNDRRGCSVSDGRLSITGTNRRIDIPFNPQTWRFFLRWKMKLASDHSSAEIRLLTSNGNTVLETTIDNEGLLKYSTGKDTGNSGKVAADGWLDMKIEADLTENRYNLIADGSTIADFVPMNGMIEDVVSLSIIVDGTVMFDDFWGLGHEFSDMDRHPYTFDTFLDERFDIASDLTNWAGSDYDDSVWKVDTLPFALGGDLHKGEDLYFRKTIQVGDFERAALNVEALDPEGELWVNGRVVAVIPNRHPTRLDISKYLVRNAENTIAVRVMHYNIEEYGHKRMVHTPLDYNVGWFAGRMSLDLTGKSFIDDVFMHTGFIGVDSATMQLRMSIANEAPLSFRGQAIVTMYPWFPQESPISAAEASFPVVIGNGTDTLEGAITIMNPSLWTFDSPNLYKVVVTLKSDDGDFLDDYVITTGIRTLGQEGGTFRVNGKPEMLNGAQTFGFRAPFEKLLSWHRSCPPEWIMKEMLQIKNMNGNLLRIHIHAWSDPGRSVNDPRIAEIADQLGLMIIWPSPSWIRTAAGWGVVDFEGMPKYMRQVYNHPSIVMWEAANHPNTFKTRDSIESDLFVEKVHDTIYSLDPSRIISSTSFIKHLHYGNDPGTVDYKGEPMIPSPAWTAPMMTRGNQDSFTGYGKEWSVLRKQPDAYYAEHLASPYRAYFNFEHEESIAQPNWNLVKGKPWYKMQSYEWKYDEGSIGRKLSADEWRESQAWQAFSAWESMKKQRMLDYDGFSWCCLHGGPNSVTYKKPIIDYHGHAKLAWYTNKMLFQRVVAGSGDVDVVYGPSDMVMPVVMNLGDERTVDVTVIVKTAGKTVDSRKYENITLPSGRTLTELESFRPEFDGDGYYVLEYEVEGK